MTRQYDFHRNNESSQKDSDSWILQRSAVRSQPAKTLTPQTESPAGDRSGMKLDLMQIPVHNQDPLVVQPKPMVGSVGNHNWVCQLKEYQRNVADVGDTPVQQVAEVEAPNNTGLPNRLKAGVEKLSGMSMDDVRVNYNSDKPVKLNALAYTQGTDIHLGTGQERHLPHEAWHVVQQKQGRVRPMLEVNGYGLNDDRRLEHEADVMGQRALQSRSNPIGQQLTASNKPESPEDVSSRSIGSVSAQTPVQLRVYLSDEYFVKRLGTGNFGDAYQTDKDNVAKVIYKGKPAEEEFNLLDRIYSAQKDSGNISVVKPVFYGTIYKTDEEPRDFDKKVEDGTGGFLMEKVNPLRDASDIQDELPSQATQLEQELKIKDICIEELEIFRELMEVRRKFINSGYEHNDIKHKNVGRDNTGNLKAFDVGLAKKYEKEKQPKKILKEAINTLNVVQDDVYFSYRLTLERIVERLSVLFNMDEEKKSILDIYRKMSRSNERVVPDQLLNALSNVRWPEQEQNTEQESINNLKEPTFDYIMEVVQEWVAQNLNLQIVRQKYSNSHGD